MSNDYGMDAVAKLVAVGLAAVGVLAVPVGLIALVWWAWHHVVIR